jgi:hypothetical protein
MSVPLPTHRRYLGGHFPPDGPLSVQQRENFSDVVCNVGDRTYRDRLLRGQSETGVSAIKAEFLIGP